MGKSTLGEQELEVLRWVTDHPGVTVREVALEWGEPRGLARTTILTMMESLRSKGFLDRNRGPQAWRYSAVVSKGELLKRLVGEFITNTLKGSVSPLAAYLAGSRDVTDEELAELHEVVEKLRADRKDS